MTNNSKELGKEVKLTSTNRGFRIVNHMVARDEQTKK